MTDRAPELGARTSSHRWFSRIGTVLAMVTATLLSLISVDANASTVIGGGTIGTVHSYGGTTCNPLRAGGVARQYVAVGSPLVAPSRAVYTPNTQVIGGGQEIVFQASLEKYVGNTWVLVWRGPVQLPVGFRDDLYTFSDLWVDIRQLGAYSGAGYYRSGGAIVWKANAIHPNAGWVSYTLGVGNYSKDAWANYNQAGATMLNTPYCWAG